MNDQKVKVLNTTKLLIEKAEEIIKLRQQLTETNHTIAIDPPETLDGLINQLNSNEAITEKVIQHGKLIKDSLYLTEYLISEGKNILSLETIEEAKGQKIGFEEDFNTIANIKLLLMEEAETLKKLL